LIAAAPTPRAQAASARVCVPNPAHREARRAFAIEGIDPIGICTPSRCSFAADVIAATRYT
jgi:hypothetical protein